jgi:hypothetical protein
VNHSSLRQAGSPDIGIVTGHVHHIGRSVPIRARNPGFSFYFPQARKGLLLILTAITVPRPYTVLVASAHVGFAKEPETSKWDIEKNGVT